MRIACSRCHAAYEVPDEKLARAAVKIRCSLCGQLFVARRRQVEEAQSSPATSPFDDFDFGSIDEPATLDEPAIASDLAPETAPPREDALTGPEDSSFSDLFDETTPAPEEEAPASSLWEDRVEGDEPPPDSAPVPKAEPTKEAPLPDLDSLSFDDLQLPDLGELDLGDFDAPAEPTPEEEPGGPKPRSEREPLERVRPDELVSPPADLKEVPLRGLADDLPGPQPKAAPPRGRGEGRSPLVARDRRPSPLLWAVVFAALATIGYTGYNLVRRPEAFTFVNPAKLMEYWRGREVEAKLGLEEVKGYYRNFPGGRRVFVIQGQVSNRSEKPQGLIRVKGSLFGPEGSRVAAREAYCGNVFNDRELASLPRETIEARLQNQVGQALSNVDVAPGNKVPFMVIFTPPPESVEKYDVSVTAYKGAESQ